VSPLDDRSNAIYGPCQTTRLRLNENLIQAAEATVNVWPTAPVQALNMLRRSTAVVSKLSCQRATEAITRQFEGRTSYVIRLFRDMLHSATSYKINCFENIVFYV